MPVNGTEVQSTVTRSSGLIVLTSISPMVPMVTPQAQRQWRIKLPKPQDFWQLFTAKTAVIDGGVGWKTMRVSWGSRSKWWCGLNLVKSTTTKASWVAVLEASITRVLAVFRRRWQRGYDRHRSNFRSIPSLTRTVAENKSWSRVDFASRVGSNGSISLSLACPLSFHFWKPAPLFLFIETSFHFFKAYCQLS